VGSHARGASLSPSLSISAPTAVIGVSRMFLVLVMLVCELAPPVLAARMFRCLAADLQLAWSLLRLRLLPFLLPLLVSCIC
jgi:hypothetical protein